MHASLVPAYQPCASPNRTHGPPLAFASCSPPTRTPGQLTVGTRRLQRPGRQERRSRADQARAPGHAPNPADEADVRMFGPASPTYAWRSDLSDYTGTLRGAHVSLRITDKDNTPHPGGPGAGTVQDLTYSFPHPMHGHAPTRRVGGDLRPSTPPPRRSCRAQ